MADSVFIIRVLLSVFVGGAWIASTTLVAERLGARVGGILGGVPSTVAISLLFVGWTGTPQTAAAATTAVPFFVGVYGPLVLVYVWLGQHLPAAQAVTAAGVVWLALTLAIIEVGHDNFLVGLIVELVLLAVTQLVLATRLPVVARFASSAVVSLATLAIRASIGGLVVGSAVVLARIGGPVVGGAASAFPAVLLATTVITRRSQGKEFSDEVARTIMISAGINIAVYVTVVRFTYPAWGIAVGTCIAFAASLAVAFAIYRLMAQRRRASR
jgi:hypothetical protein